MIRATRGAGFILMLAGTAMLGHVAYGYWHGDASARHHRQALTQKLQRDLSRPLITAGRAACSRPEPATGRPFAFLHIPRLGQDWRLPVIQGTGERELNTGAVGHVPGTGMPGYGNLAVAAHVVSAGNPFLRLSRLRRGDSVTVTDRCGSYTYRVTWRRVVDEHAVGVLAPVAGKPVITLITCHPAVYWSTPHRLIVRGVLESGPLVR
ncbi:MAG TPA: sortase [Streptosporangiaceae bacterium]